MKAMDEKKKNYDSLKEFCLGQGASLFGAADIAPIKDEFHISRDEIEGLDRGISIGYRLSDRVLEGIQDRPTKIYYHHYRQVNLFLDQLALRVVGLIQKAGYQAMAIPASQIIDWEKQLGHLSHKRIGMLAGLGWAGRNNLLVNPRLGARFRLMTLLTDMPLSCDEKIKADCGDCKDCLKVCPTDAIKEKQKDFGHIRCYEKLREFRKLGYTDQFICGICVKACKGHQGHHDS